MVSILDTLGYFMVVSCDISCLGGGGMNKIAIGNWIPVIKSFTAIIHQYWSWLNLYWGLVYYWVYHMIWVCLNTSYPKILWSVNINDHFPIKIAMIYSISDKPFWIYSLLIFLAQLNNSLIIHYTIFIFAHTHFYIANGPDSSMFHSYVKLPKVNIYHIIVI